MVAFSSKERGKTVLSRVYSFINLFLLREDVLTVHFERKGEKVELS